MSIEKTLERIAAALETIAAGGGLAAAPEPEAEAPAKPPAKKSAKKQTVGKTDEPDHDITKDQVRAQLQAVQKATTPAQAKSILKQHGASTIGNLAVSKYQQVLDDCAKVLEDG